MTPSLEQHWADLRRQGRLLLRHARSAAGALSGRGGRDKQEALAVLFRTVNAWLAECGVDYWIVFGTLLGWHREGRIMAHDSDVDFGAPETAYGRILACRNRLPRGYELFDTSHRHGGPKLYVSCGSWEADIYFFRQTEGRLQAILRGGYPSDTLPFPREWFYPPRTAELLGARTVVPGNAEAYLVHTYGYIGPDAFRDRATGYFRPRHAAAQAAFPDRPVRQK